MSIITDNIMIGPFVFGALATGVILYIVYCVNKYRENKNK